MRTTYITAAVIAFVIVAWLLSGQVNKPDPVASKTLAEQNRERLVQSEDDQPTAVRGRVIQASEHQRQVRVRGRTQNKRTVMARAEIVGRVVERPVERGSRVEKNQLLCRLSLDDRQAGLTEARAGLAQAQIEYQGSLKLKAKGFQSDTVIAQAKARLASAQAQVTRRQLDLARTSIRAPFAGVVEAVAQEVGDYVTPGSVCATLVDLDPMLLEGRIPERDVQQAVVGKSAVGILADGTEVQGQLTFVGNQGEATTRTYAISVEVPNPNGTIRSGITTDILIPVGSVLAHKISPALFALNDAGVVGVRTVNADDRVEFHPIDIIANEVDGALVTGLPAVATLITVGQELVVPGDRVTVNFEASGELPAKAAPTDKQDRDAATDDAAATIVEETQLSGDTAQSVLAANAG